MFPPLPRLRFPRWMLAMTIVVALGGWGASMLLSLMGDTGYPDRDIISRTSIPNGSDVVLDEGLYVTAVTAGERAGSAVQCSVTGDVVESGVFSGTNYFITGSGGSYTVTCAPDVQTLDLDWSSARYMEFYVDGMRAKELAATVRLWSAVGTGALMLLGFLAYAAQLRKQKAVVRQFKSQGLPPVQDTNGMAITGVAVAVLGLALLVLGSLGDLSLRPIPGLFLLILGVIFFVGGGGLKEDRLRRHEEAWQNWVLKQQAAYGQAASMSAPAPAGPTAPMGPTAPAGPPAPSDPSKGGLSSGNR